MGREDQQSRVFYELCDLLLSILRSPHIAFPCTLPTAGMVSPPPSPPPPARVLSGSQVVRRSQVSPAGFASLLLGVSLALMLCGSVTFMIGFILMPWVLGLVMLFYFVGFVSNLSGLGRAILCPGSACTKEMSGQFLSKLPII